MSRYDITIAAFDPLFDSFRQFGPPGAAIADRYDVDGKRFRIIGVGASHDPGSWFVTSELAHRTSRSIARNSYGAYVTAGYRAGAFTPYMTLARTRMSGATSEPGLPLAGLPPDAAEQARALNDALNELLALRSRQRTVSVGTRWDFARNAALKVQYDYIDLDRGSPGLLVNLQPGFRPGGSVSLFSPHLKQMGVHVAIDDFGTGYSSLSALRDLPVDTIKIDGSFVRDISRSPEGRSLTEAIIAVGRNLGLTVVAECVESPNEAEFLRSHACDEFQGFFINNPMPADQFAELIRNPELSEMEGSRTEASSRSISAGPGRGPS